jgi:ubiquinone biosynthesis protein
MDDLTIALISHRDRLRRVSEVLVRYGFAGWVTRSETPGESGVFSSLRGRAADDTLVGLSQGERLRGVLVELGTTWVKFGQMLSLRPDVVGPEVAAELALLQAAVPADPPGVAQALVEAELGMRAEQAFGSFDPDPFASGSVAQVHAATLPDGTDVVVKVLHDGAERVVADDLALMTALARFLEQRDQEIAQYRPSILVGEFAGMMRSAVDLSQERSNLEQFTASFAGEPDVVIPTAYPEVSTRRILTMSRIEGASFSDRASVAATGWDVDTLVQRATDIYLEMIFRDGLYHADPHPGNFMLPDGQHLAILDFGDVGRVSHQRRDQLETLVIAGVARDVESLTDMVIELTTPPPGTDLVGLRADIDSWMNRYLLAGVAHLDVAGIIDSGMDLMHKHHLVLPADLALLFRVLLRLQGLGQGVGTEVKVTELLRPYVADAAAKRFDPRRLAHQAARNARGWDRFLSSLPQDMTAILEQVRTGELGVDFRVHDADGAADRLVDGLIASASLLASAQLLSRRTGPTVGGLSVAGLVAAGVGAATWQRLAGQRQGHQSPISRARRLAGTRRA